MCWGLMVAVELALWLVPHRPQNPPRSNLVQESSHVTRTSYLLVQSCHVVWRSFNCALLAECSCYLTEKRHQPCYGKIVHQSHVLLMTSDDCGLWSRTSSYRCEGYSSLLELSRFVPPLRRVLDHSSGKVEHVKAPLRGTLNPMNH